MDTLSVTLRIFYVITLTQTSSFMQGHGGPESATLSFHQRQRMEE